jgi:ribose 5-phosphate isomerase A
VLVRVLSGVEASKERVALEACKLLKELSGVEVVGVGTGSTVRRFVDLCMAELRSKLLVASSIDTTLYVRSKGLRTLEVYAVEGVDVYIDGADEVSARLDLVKGGGGALLREKTLAYMSSLRVYIVDYTKYTGKPYLYEKPIPIEVAPFALNYVLREVRKMGVYEPTLRAGGGKYGPTITDNYNFIVDLKPLRPVENPLEAHKALKSIHGVIETGIFPSKELVDMVIVGYPERALVLRKG